MNDLNVLFVDFGAPASCSCCLLCDQHIWGLYFILDEQLLALYGHKNSPDEPLKPIKGSVPSNNSPASRTNDHYNGHSTRNNYLNTLKHPELGESLLYMVPSPQRAKGDNSGKAYTKSPDYADSYEKVKKAK